MKKIHVRYEEHNVWKISFELAGIRFSGHVQRQQQPSPGELNNWAWHQIEDYIEMLHGHYVEGQPR